MRTTNQELEARRLAARARERLIDDLRRLCADSAVSTRMLAAETGLDRGYIARILRNEANPTWETCAKLAVVLGADFFARLYPNTGPAIHDRHQAPILEELLGLLHPRWRPFTEVGVRHPARGWIDVVLYERRATLAIAGEIESDLRRLEQQLRWSQEKAESLSSWSGWSDLGDDVEISRLLLVRRTRSTRAVARDFAKQIALAFPAHPDDAMAALSGTMPWPGPALVWVSVGKNGVRFLGGR